jgi:uncharacterized protein
LRVFLDTNVLVSAFATRGLCADLLQRILVEQEFVTAEVVLEELRRVLHAKIRLAADRIDTIEAFVRQYHVEPRPAEVPEIALRDPADRLVLASALAARADVLVTGDKELLDAGEKVSALVVADPRTLWNMLRGATPGRR